jgi:hypothetical protein
MTSPIVTLDGCTRCPVCHLAPTVTFETFNTNYASQVERIVLQCKEHGHMSIGDTVPAAVENWNLYLALSAKAVA